MACPEIHTVFGCNLQDMLLVIKNDKVKARVISDLKQSASSIAEDLCDAIYDRNSCDLDGESKVRTGHALFLSDNIFDMDERGALSKGFDNIVSQVLNENDAVTYTEWGDYDGPFIVLYEYDKFKLTQEELENKIKEALDKLT